MHHHGEFDCLVLKLQQLFSVSQWKTAIFVNGKQQFLCWELPKVTFLYIVLHMAIKLSRHQCQCFAFSYHRQREISYKSVSHIPVCPRLAAKVWLVWSRPYQFLCILLDLTVTLPRGLQYPCTQRPCRAMLTC